jgi:hypothetical protein
LPARRRGGRLPRRSTGDIATLIERIIDLVKQHPNGLRAEEIRRELSLQAKELPRPLGEALESGRLGKSGQKRATTYFVKGAGRVSKASGGGAATKAAGGKRKRRRAGGSGKKSRTQAVQRARKVERAQKAEKKAVAAPPAPPVATPS